MLSLVFHDHHRICREWIWRLADGSQDGPYTFQELHTYSTQGFTSGEVRSTLSGVPMRLTKLMASPAMPAEESRIALEQLQVSLAAAQEVERGRVAQLVPLLDNVSHCYCIMLLGAAACVNSLGMWRHNRWHMCGG
jgi:hypothetical protein